MNCGPFKKTMKDLNLRSGLPSSFRLLGSGMDEYLAGEEWRERDEFRAKEGDGSSGEVNSGLLRLRLRPLTF